MIDKSFGMQIKKRRGELGLTQQEFAEKVGLSTGYISALEQGKSFPSYEKLIVIINGLETSADRLFGEQLDYGCVYRAAEANKNLISLPIECQKCILAITEMLIDLAARQANTAEGRY